MPTLRTSIRKYHSPERLEQRNRTRLAILEAAEAVFGERGYGAATMPSVARVAGVSLPTVYLYFRSKPALVKSLAEQVTGFADLDVGLTLAEADPLRQLEIGAGTLRKLHQRSEVVVEVLRSGAGADPELDREWRRWRDRHLAAVQAVAQSLDAQGALRDGVDVSAATDVLYMIAGPDTFRQLVRDRGWSPRRYERWLVEAGKRLLL